MNDSSLSFLLNILRTNLFIMKFQSTYIHTYKYTYIHTYIHTYMQNWFLKITNWCILLKFCRDIDTAKILYGIVWCYFRSFDFRVIGGCSIWYKEVFFFFFFFFYNGLLGPNLDAVARSEASSLGMQAAPSSIPTSGTFFHGDLVMKTFLRPFSLFCWFKKSSCQLLAKECALSTGKLPRRLAQEQCG